MPLLLYLIVKDQFAYRKELTFLTKMITHKLKSLANEQFKIRDKYYRTSSTSSSIKNLRIANV
ncbi:MAG: hypothetical protein LBT09_13940 [Planctomycetaceae bacterium]|nr:hypothetical protein [Planctomycetaceae bacterium]